MLGNSKFYEILDFFMKNILCIAFVSLALMQYSLGALVMRFQQEGSDVVAHLSGNLTKPSYGVNWGKGSENIVTQWTSATLYTRSLILDSRMPGPSSSIEFWVYGVDSAVSNGKLFDISSYAFTFNPAGGDFDLLEIDLRPESAYTDSYLHIKINADYAPEENTIALSHDIAIMRWENHTLSEVFSSGWTGNSITRDGEVLLEVQVVPEAGTSLLCLLGGILSCLRRKR